MLRQKTTLSLTNLHVLIFFFFLLFFEILEMDKNCEYEGFNSCEQNFLIIVKHKKTLKV